MYGSTANIGQGPVFLFQSPPLTKRSPSWTPIDVTARENIWLESQRDALGLPRYSIDEVRFGTSAKTASSAENRKNEVAVKAARKDLESSIEQPPLCDVVAQFYQTPHIK